MNEVPRLSIGLPVYNGEKFLAESIESLLGQTYEDFELIISDNASTDGTADICRRYAQQDPRIRYIRQRQNIGSAPNHNFVIRAGAGRTVQARVPRRSVRPQSRSSSACPRSTSIRRWSSPIPGPP